MKNLKKLLITGLLVIGQSMTAISDESIFTTASKNMLTMNITALAGGFMVMPVPAKLKPLQLKFNNSVKDIVVNKIPKANLRDSMGKDDIATGIEGVIFTAGAMIGCGLTIHTISSVIFGVSDYKAADKICTNLYIAFLASAAADKAMNDSI